ncbi:tripartite tricarboxylate transporter permease [Candidatus Woesearchaeota archaeon]|nr:tripartite tricarboxylate transporter permease [Candidatus Woesearchaeota archaeon]
MYTDLLIAVCVGLAAGTFTGLVPGVHINLVSMLLVAASPVLLRHTTWIPLACFIVAMSVTHSFLDFIPGVFLGAPDADTALSVLPGHKLLLAGRAFDAVRLTLIGSLISLALCVLLMPLLLPVVGSVYTLLKPWIGHILAVLMLYMVMKDRKRFANLLIFLLTGTLGIVVLNFPRFSEPLFPMLSGLFGLSTLVISYFDEVRIPPQLAEESSAVSVRDVAGSVGAATLAGALTSFFPGLGAAQGAVLAMQLFRDIRDEAFLILVGGINTVNFTLSLVTLYVIDKARNGAVIAISTLAGEIGLPHLGVFAAAALVAGGCATLLALPLTLRFARIIPWVDYQALVLTIAALIVILSFVFSGWVGLLVLATATCLGIMAVRIGVARNHCMGCLILPVICFFLL